MARMHPPSIPETPPDVLRDDQLHKLLAVCAGQAFDERRDKAVILLLIDTGVRLGEIAGLRVEDIDWSLEIINVTGKGSRPRAVAFGRKVAQALDRRFRSVARLRWRANPRRLALPRSARRLRRDS
jgi:site-specific recombinase XerD